MQQTLKITKQLLNFVATQVKMITYKATDMILVVHIMHHFSVHQNHIAAMEGIFFSQGTKPSPQQCHNPQHHKSNQGHNVICCWSGAWSPVCQCKTRVAILDTLTEMGHPHLPMPIQTNNLKAMGTITNTILPKATKPWTCNSIGWETEYNNSNFNICGIHAKQILMTTGQNTTALLTTRPCNQNLWHPKHK